jgi:hypothetical protein
MRRQQYRKSLAAIEIMKKPAVAGFFIFALVVIGGLEPPTPAL